MSLVFPHPEEITTIPSETIVGISEYVAENDSYSMNRNSLMALEKSERRSNPGGEQENGEESAFQYAH